MNDASPSPCPAAASDDQASIDWNPNQHLWIHLYYELLLAATSKDSAPIVWLYESYIHTRFLEAFGADAKNGEFTTAGQAPEEESFVAMRNNLVPAKVSKLALDRKKRIQSENSLQIQGFSITLEMLAAYQRLRGNLALSEEIACPETRPELWKFLTTIVNEQHPELERTTTLNASAAVENVSQTLGAQVDPTPVSSSEQASDLTTTYDASATVKTAMYSSGTDIDATFTMRPEEASTEPEIPTHPNATRARQDTILKLDMNWSKKVKVQCTANEEDGERCQHWGKVTVLESIQWKTCDLHKGKAPARARLQHIITAAWVEDYNEQPVSGTEAEPVERPRKRVRLESTRLLSRIRGSWT